MAIIPVTVHMPVVSSIPLDIIQDRLNLGLILSEPSPASVMTQVIPELRSCSFQPCVIAA
jgi:hypothetical protein